MPIPKPRNDEAGNDFITRCMADDIMVEEYPENDQRLAICFQAWRNRNKQEDNDMERKSVMVQLKEDKVGSFVARIATLNVVDKDGDRTLPGAFPTGRTVLVSAYQHGSWDGSLPVGKATIHEEGEQVLAEGEFNLATQSGREHYEAVKFSGELQEWSYGYRVEDSNEITEDGQEIRELKKVDPIEISPVLLGAGVGTTTLAIKAITYNCECIECGYKLESKQHCDKIKCPECGGEMRRAERPGPGKSINQGSTYAEEAETVLAAVTELTARTKSLADLRRKDGRNLSTLNMERLAKLIDALEETATGLKEITVAPEPDNKKARKLVLDFLRLQNQIAEVTNEND